MTRSRLNRQAKENTLHRTTTTKKEEMDTEEEAFQKKDETSIDVQVETETDDPAKGNHSRRMEGQTSKGMERTTPVLEIRTMTTHPREPTMSPLRLTIKDPYLKMK